MQHYIHLYHLFDQRVFVLDLLKIHFPWIWKNLYTLSQDDYAFSLMLSVCHIHLMIIPYKHKMKNPLKIDIKITRYIFTCKLF